MTTVAHEVLTAPRERAVRHRHGREREHRGLVAVANTAVLAAAILMVIGIVGSMAGWWRVETVLSGSMRPTIHPGDLEILRRESTASVRVGQIVAFHPPHETITVTHRVVALDRRASGVWVVTKGDANNTKDPWGTVRLTGDHVWTVIGVVPRAGTVDVWLRQPQLHLGLLIAVGLLCAAIALEAIWRQ